MSQKYSQCNRRNQKKYMPILWREALRQPHCQPSFRRIAEQGQRGGGFSAAAQHIGRARIMRTVSARIRQMERTAHYHGKGNRPQQIGSHNKNQGYHPEYLKMRKRRILRHNLLPAMDIIFLRELKVETLIGVYEWEKRVAQTLQIDLEIALPNSRACHSDDINDALNYADIVRHIKDVLISRHFNLLEALAEHIAHILLTDFNAPWVKVSIAKLNAIRGNRMVGVSIERGQVK